MKRVRAIDSIKVASVLMSTLFVLTGCWLDDDSGTDGTYEPALCDRFGLMLIETPTYSDTYSVSIPFVQIAGYAPLAQMWYDCYPCVPTSPGVDVIWTNDATGVTDTAFSWVRTTWNPLFGLYYSHQWADAVALEEGDNLITVAAMEGDDHVGNDCILVTYVIDLEAPAIPSDLTATAFSPSEVRLSWSLSADNATTDDAAVYYNIYRDDVFLKSVDDTFTSDTGLEPGTTYCYKVSAYDRADNESLPTAAVCVKTLDQAEPTVPANLHSSITASGNIEAAWSASSDDVAVTGYRIIRNGVYLASVTTTNYMDTAVVPDTRYCYTVAAYDEAGNESAFSTESCSDTSWAFSIIDSSSFIVGDDSAIAVDSTGAIHIGYHDDSQDDLKYATNKSGAWVSETVDSYADVGGRTAIALDSKDFVHLAYVYQGEWFGGTYSWYFDLKYATNISGVWTNTVVGYGGWYNSIAVDSQDFLHIGHNEYGYGGLRYATNLTGNWEDKLIATPTLWASIAIDAADAVHMSSYQGYPENSLIYLSNKTGAWTSEPVDTDNAGEFSDLAIDANGKTHISYCKFSGGLSYATNASGTWQTYYPDGLVIPSSCNYTSLALDTDGHVHISYITDIDYTTHSGYLTYITNKSGTWLKTSLVRTGTLSGNPAYPVSIALDAAGNVHISYFGADEDLRYITNR